MAKETAKKTKFNTEAQKPAIKFNDTPGHYEEKAKKLTAELAVPVMKYFQRDH